MKKILLLLPVLLALTTAAQNISEIRQYYTEINTKITQSLEQGFEGPLYNNHWVTNHHNRSWPAVGNYSETTDFWYDDPPYHLPAEERDPKNVLVKVTMTRISSHLKADEEYLFKDGKLIFFFRKEAEEGKQWETRIYFDNQGAVIKTSVKANNRELTDKDFLTEEFRDFRPDGVTVMEVAKKYQDLFVKSNS